jgi:hypothetical protein
MNSLYSFFNFGQLDTQLHDRRQISGQTEVEPKERSFRNHYAFSASASISGSLLNEWSQEELQLATGGQETTHVQHQLKLNSAYSGVPVSVFVSCSRLVDASKRVEICLTGKLSS